MKGELPWQSLKSKVPIERSNKVMEIKIQTSIESLCKGCPKEMEVFMHYIRDLRFDEKPDYSYLRNVLRDVAKSNNIEYDGVFDWYEKMKEIA
jgi:hypothetical protein